MDMVNLDFLSQSFWSLVCHCLAQSISFFSLVAQCDASKINRTDWIELAPLVYQFLAHFNLVPLCIQLELCDHLQMAYILPAFLQTTEKSILLNVHIAWRSWGFICRVTFTWFLLRASFWNLILWRQILNWLQGIGQGFKGNGTFITHRMPLMSPPNQTHFAKLSISLFMQDLFEHTIRFLVVRIVPAKIMLRRCMDSKPQGSYCSYPRCIFPEH